MASYPKIYTNAVIIGGGLMGMTLAYRASLAGLDSVVIEGSRIGNCHYATGLWSPRSDYIPKDMDEVIRTDAECAVWRDMFPGIFVPQKFIIPFNSSVPHEFESFLALLELYEKVTPKRSKALPGPCFILGGSQLEISEPNLKKGMFDRALCLYEFTADLDIVNRLLWSRIFSMGHSLKFFSKNSIKFSSVGNSITGLHFVDDQNRHVDIRGTHGNLVIVNVAGPWMNDVASGLGIRFPVDLYSGIQISLNMKGYLNSNVILFDEHGKYIIAMPKKDHLQVGPSNAKIKGFMDDFIEDRNEIMRQAEDMKRNVLKIMKPGYEDVDLKIKAVGARVKLSLPFKIDSNRPIVFDINDIGIENYFAVYPGKLPSAFRAAEGLLKVIQDRGFIKSYPKFKSSKGILISSKRSINMLRLLLEKIKSLMAIGSFILLRRFWPNKNK